MSDVEEKTHARYSASGAHRWLECPASVALSEHAPPQKDSPYALEGTKAHGVLESMLQTYLQAKQDHIPALYAADDVPEEMFQHALKAAIYIMDLHKKEGGELLCETKVQLDFVREEMYGSE